MSQVGNSLPKDSVLERIQLMMHQEDTTYRYESYFPPSLSLEELEHAKTLNATWREKICQWSYNVVDHFDIPREVVAISLNLFDRYLATQGNKCTGNMALLASLTTLHIAIKIHSEKKVKISSLASLSRGQFGAKHIEQMEWEVFRAVHWKLHPPTLFAIISHLLMLFPADVHHTSRKELFEVAIYIAELSVCDSYFCSFPASTVALAAIMNVMDDMSLSKLSLRSRDMFWTDISLHLPGFHARSAQVLDARERLRAMFGSESSTCESTATNSSTKSSSLGDHAMTTSPTSTADMHIDEATSMSSCSMSQQHHYQHESKSAFHYTPSPPTTSRRNHVMLASSPMTSSRSYRGS